jgi:hypothetical protein
MVRLLVASWLGRDVGRWGGGGDPPGLRANLAAPLLMLAGDANAAVRKEALAFWHGRLVIGKTFDHDMVVCPFNYGHTSVCPEQCKGLYIMIPYDNA